MSKIFTKGYTIVVEDVNGNFTPFEVDEVFLKNLYKELEKEFEPNKNQTLYRSESGILPPFKVTS